MARCAVRDELLNREIFYSLMEAQIIIEQWRREYNQIRPHSALFYRLQAPEEVLILPLAAPLYAPVAETTTKKLDRIMGWSWLARTLAPAASAGVDRRYLALEREGSKNQG